MTGVFLKPILQKVMYPPIYRLYLLLFLKNPPCFDQVIKNHPVKKNKMSMDTSMGPVGIFRRALIADVAVPLLLRIRRLLLGLVASLQN